MKPDTLIIAEISIEVIHSKLINI